jgi:gas vesicle protein
MATLMTGIMIAGILGGAASGGYSAYQLKSKLRSSICNIAQQMKNYQDSMNSTFSLLDLEIVNIQPKINNTAETIATLKKNFHDQKQQFKSEYNKMVFLSILFLIVVTFILGTKRFILK